MKRVLWISGLSFLLVLSLFFSACVQQADTGQSTVSPTVETTSVLSPSVAEPALPSIIDVVAKVRPSVVSINVDITTYNAFNQPVQGQGAGSGWIMRSDGYIVTNNHVVEGSRSVDY